MNEDVDFCYSFVYWRIKPDGKIWFRLNEDEEFRLEHGNSGGITIHQEHHWAFPKLKFIYDEMVEKIKTHPVDIY